MFTNEYWGPTDLMFLLSPGSCTVHTDYLMPLPVMNEAFLEIHSLSHA